MFCTRSMHDFSDSDRENYVYIVWIKYDESTNYWNVSFMCSSSSTSTPAVRYRVLGVRVEKCAKKKKKKERKQKEKKEKKKVEISKRFPSCRVSDINFSRVSPLVKKGKNKDRNEKFSSNRTIKSTFQRLEITRWKCSSSNVYKILIFPSSKYYTTLLDNSILSKNFIRFVQLGSSTLLSIDERTLKKKNDSNYFNECFLPIIPIKREKKR